MNSLQKKPEATAYLACLEKRPNVIVLTHYSFHCRVYVFVCALFMIYIQSECQVILGGDDGVSLRFLCAKTGDVLDLVGDHESFL